MHGPPTGFISIVSSHVHLFKNWGVEHQAVGTVCSHDEPCPALESCEATFHVSFIVNFFGLFFIVDCVILGVSARAFRLVADVDFEDSHAVFFPLLFEMVQLRSTAKNGLFLFFPSFNCCKVSLNLM